MYHPSLHTPQTRQKDIDARSSGPIRLSVTRGDLEYLKLWLVAKIQLASFHGELIQIRALNENMEAVAVAMRQLQ